MKFKIFYSEESLKNFRLLSRDLFGFEGVLVYTTNAIESVNFTLRKIIKNKQLFPNDLAIKKIIYLALRNIAKKWSMPIKDWKPALNQFAIIFADRFPHDF